MIAVRRAGADDLDVILADVQTGFDFYRSFAPEGWEPPQASADRGPHAELLAEASTRAWVALAEGRTVGHVSFYPGRERSPDDTPAIWRTRPEVPGLAHLWQLFVLPEWWGQGVAPVLHETAVAAMKAEGYERARLFTPSLHTRARRFYERRGWIAGPEEFHPGLGLTLTEYRLALRA